ncbi:MAG TPA: hypothetical protein VK671_04170 [Mucilaginibacter sp.]|jgi:hypothetical protein|nr:hypothetical protein [Mucilaginibacter sp.]
MKPKLLLRIAAILILIHGVLHTMGFSQWKQDPDPARHEVIKQMTGQKLPFMGTSRNMGEYYDGFGYSCSIALILIALLLWIVSGELSSNPSLAKKVILVISFSLLVWATDELIYFFPFAAGLTLVASVCGFGSLPGLAKQRTSK